MTRIFLVLLFVTPVGLLAQNKDLLSAQYPDYAVASATAKKYLTEKKYPEAVQAYQQALELAKSDDERAGAYLGIAEANEGILINPNPEKISKAYLAVTLLKNATTVQKKTACDQLARILLKEDKFSEAISAMSGILKLKGMSPGEKAEVFQFNARVYLIQKLFDKAVAEINYITDLRMDTTRAIDIYTENGRLLYGYKLFPAARAEFEKSLNFLKKKSYQLPRNLTYIAQSYEQERNYDKAREVLNKMFYMPEISAFEKEEGWILMGNMYNEEKKYQQAVDAFTILGDNHNLTVLKKIKTRLGLARAMYGMGYLSDAKIHYLEVLTQINQVDKVSVNQQVPGMSPYDRQVYLGIRADIYNDAKARVEEIAAKGQ